MESHGELCMKERRGFVCDIAVVVLSGGLGEVH